MREISRSILLLEARNTAATPSGVGSDHPATDRMQPQLSRLLGHGGTRAILGRALVLAVHEAPWLSGASVDADGDIQGLQQLSMQIDPETFREGEVVLLAQLLTLLVNFIGPTLTSGLVGEAWPHTAFDDRDFERD